ncbi:MAG: type II secretion system secretin GspD [Betaproteobacteria bacterium]|nr:type II secretion system secretin GspD [Betaproteobacteria bacterium]
MVRLFEARWRRIAAFAMSVTLLLALALPTGQAMAQNNNQKNSDEVTLNFVNADIEAVVRSVSEITGRNFIIDPKVKGTVNIVSTQPVSRDLVYPTLLSALRLQGITAVEGNGVIRIVPETDAKLYADSGKTGGDQLVTRVIPLHYESATPMVGILRPLVSPNNSVLAFPGNNALVITDYAENMKRLERVIASLDQPPIAEPLMVRLKNASALDMVPLLNKLLTEGAVSNGGIPGGDAMQKVTLVADPRSNSVLIRCDNPGRAEKIRGFIEKLDVPGRPDGNFFIIYLKNADAQSVAQTLQGLLTGNSSGSTTSIAKPATQNTSASTNTSLANNNNNTNTSSGTASGMSNVEQLPFAPPPENGVGFSANGITVQADIATNSIVVMAPEPIYNTIRTIVEKLDVPRAQVFIEALIVEMSADKAAEFGIQWQVNSKSNRGVIGGTNFGAQGSGQNIIGISLNPYGVDPTTGTVTSGVGQGLNLGFIDGLFGGNFLNLGVLARALESQVKANILSTPTLLTLDNQEAQIMVGENVPLLTGSYLTNTASSTDNPFQTYNRQDVGLLLRIKPQITENGTVRLNIYQEVSRVMNSSASPTIQKRTVQSVVSVDDTQIIVLGGLIQDEVDDSNDSVPILGDIPLLGRLFRYDSRSHSKTNLMIFLRPTIVRSNADSREYTTERYRYLMGEQKNLMPQKPFFWSDPTIPELLPQSVLPGSEKPLPIPPRGTPLPSGAMLISPQPFTPDRTYFSSGQAATP